MKYDILALFFRIRLAKARLTIINQKRRDSKPLGFQKGFTNGFCLPSFILSLLAFAGMEPGAQAIHSS